MNGEDLSSIDAVYELAPHVVDSLRSLVLMYGGSNFYEIINTARSLPAELQAVMIERVGIMQQESNYDWWVNTSNKLVAAMPWIGGGAAAGFYVKYLIDRTVDPNRFEDLDE